MIKQADECKFVRDLQANLNLKLAVSKESIITSTKVLEERNIAQLH